jgi:hypothetical protein
VNRPKSLRMHSIGSVLQLALAFDGGIGFLCFSLPRIIFMIFIPLLLRVSNIEQKKISCYEAFA